MTAGDDVSRIWVTMVNGSCMLSSICETTRPRKGSPMRKMTAGRRDQRPGRADAGVEVLDVVGFAEDPGEDGRPGHPGRDGRGQARQEQGQRENDRRRRSDERAEHLSGPARAP